MVPEKTDLESETCKHIDIRSEHRFTCEQTDITRDNTYTVYEHTHTVSSHIGKRWRQRHNKKNTDITCGHTDINVDNTDTACGLKDVTWNVKI